MSLTAQICSSDSAFKLSQKLVTALAEKFSFKFEDGWSAISNRTIENVQKRLKRERRKNNPVSSVKKPRTAFSFFTQAHRPVVQKANPTANFGQLSRLVSADWKKLSEADMNKYKSMECADKARYTAERQTVLDAVAAAPVAEAAPVAAEAAPAKEKKVRAPKSAPAAVAATAVVAAPADAAAPKAAKPAKPAKAAAIPAPAAAAPAPTPVAEVKATKAPKAAKAAATPAATPVTAPAPAKAAATTKPAAKKAGKQ